jgi:hypothetical protein
MTSYSDDFRLTSLKEKGMLQYFWHSPSSQLPIRDVLGENKEGRKPEPHIEIGAENFIAKCYQRNIKKFSLRDEKYLFLVTTCRNRERKCRLKEQYIVGYIVKEEAFIVNDHVCVKGPTKLVPFSEDLRMTEFFGRRFSRKDFIQNPWVPRRETESIKKILDSYPNILRECINEISRLDEKGSTCRKETCMFEAECLRFQ